MSQKLRVSMVSESVFTLQAHGVHTAFEEALHMLNASGHVVTVNKFNRKADITHIQTLGPYSLLHLLFGPGKKVVSVHVIPDSLVGSIAGAKHFYGVAEWYMRWFYSRADLLLPVSKMVDQTLRKQLHITKPSGVLYNTIDMSAYAPNIAERTATRDLLGFTPDTKVVVGSGQIQPRKRFNVFCDVARALPDVQFVWVGGIPFKRLGADYLNMQQLIDARPSNLKVTGLVDRDSVKRYLWAADIFFLPSEQENHPMAVLEAAGAGLPIVVRDLPEYDDTFGKDVVRGTDDTFADLIYKLATDTDFYQQAIKGSHNVAQRFDSKTGCEQLLQSYKDLVLR